MRSDRVYDIYIVEHVEEMKRENRELRERIEGIVHENTRLEAENYRLKNKGVYMDINNDEYGFRDAAEVCASECCESCYNPAKPTKPMEIYDKPCGSWYTCGNSIECMNKVSWLDTQRGR